MSKSTKSLKLYESVAYPCKTEIEFKLLCRIASELGFSWYTGEQQMGAPDFCGSCHFCFDFRLYARPSKMLKACTIANEPAQTIELDQHLPTVVRRYIPTKEKIIEDLVSLSLTGQIAEN